jgi:hypothetical protein
MLLTIALTLYLHTGHGLHPKIAETSQMSLRDSHHYQPINVPTAGTQAFLMDYTLTERDMTHHAPSAGW